ncbi:MAG: hypothetical protein IPJ13_21635 [Saprospiraceae bacterium]|nr:hypothetical protein [Saprospiraceae bacterium]
MPIHFTLKSWTLKHVTRAFVLIYLIFGQFFSGRCYAQILLQLEVPHQIEAIKFAPGDEITFKSSDRPNEWQKEPSTISSMVKIF